MADWYVATTGNDTTGDGSAGTPYKHIFKAWQELSDGDTIYCADGTYDEEGTPLVDVGKGFTIRSSSADYSKVIIIPTALGAPGVSDRKAWVGDYGPFTIELYDLTLVLDHSKITTAYATVINALFYMANNAASSTHQRAIRCFFLAIGLPDDEYIFGMVNDFGTATNACAYKCTFRGWKNNAKSAGLYSWKLTTQYPSLTAIDCIFEGCSHGIWATYASNVITESYNCFYNNTYDIRKATADIDLDATDITTDPVFDSASVALTGPTSGCIDTGIVIATYVTTYLGSAPDRGCCETFHSVLIYTGTYNNGSSTGSVDLGTSVLSIGQISEILLGGVNRPWCQQTQVVLDDSDSYFLGTLAKGTEWYDGTFNIWGQDGTAWTKLLTGFVPASSWTYDYSQKIASLSVTSVLGKAATINMGFGGSLADSQNTFTASSNFCTLLGTITAIDSGTITVTQYGAEPLHPILNTYIWEVDADGSLDTSNQGAARLSAFQGWTEGDSGTWNLDCQFTGGTAPWMSVGAIAGRTVPYPSAQSLNAGVADGYPGIQMFFYQSGTHMGLTWDATNWSKFTSDLAIIPLACEPMVGTQLYSTVYPIADLPPSSIGTAPLYYGGGLWVETMNDMMNSVGANWTVDGNGVIRAKVKRAAALEAVTGTVSFTDAEDDLTATWTFRSTEGPSNVMVDHEWSNTEERYTGTALALGSQNTGEVMRQQAKWQRGIGGALLAERLMKWEQRIGRIFALSYPVSYWGSFVPGSLVALENIPNALNPDYNASGSAALLTAGKYVVQARNYDYMDNKIVAELRQVPPLTGVFILDISELDGTDKLY